MMRKIVLPTVKVSPSLSVTAPYLNVPLGDGADLRHRFEEQHRALYGFAKEGHPIEVVNVRVESATQPAAEVSNTHFRPLSGFFASPIGKDFNPRPVSGDST